MVKKPKAVTILAGRLSNKEKDFLNFHYIEDEADYLEITKEVKQQKNKRVTKIIEDYFIKKGDNRF